MAIEYSLVNNQLTTSQTDYRALVHALGTADLDRIVDRIQALGSTVTRADIAAVLEDSIAAIETYLLDGFRVNFGGLAIFSPSIRGVFDSATDAFDPSRHQIALSCTAGARVKRKFKERAVPQKRLADKPVPKLVEFLDVSSGQLNVTLTRGSIGRLTGKFLRYDTTKADEGLFLVRTDTGVETKVTVVDNNTSSNIVFQIPPELEEFQDYYLEVRARVSGVKDLRKGRFDQTLMAA